MPEEIIRREFPAELTPSGDGRTLDLRIVPFNTVARVSDDGGRTQYDEMWMPGAFDRQLSAPNRVDVLANFEHQQGISGVVARGTELRDTGMALDGTFRMLSTQDADKVLELVNERVVGGVSLEAIALKSERGEDGIVRRTKARLINVALCRSPAFKDAAVLAVRESPDDESEPDPDPDSERVSPQVVRVEMAAEELAKNPPEFTDAELALQRVGFEPLLLGAIVHKPWDSSLARFEDDQYQRSCLIEREGEMPVKERCLLPVLEPNGDVNVNALGSAAASLTGTRGGLRNVSQFEKATAARKLIRFFSQAEMESPEALRRLAAS